MVEGRDISEALCAWIVTRDIIIRWFNTERAKRARKKPRYMYLYTEYDVGPLKNHEIVYPYEVL